MDLNQLGLISMVRFVMTQDTHRCLRIVNMEVDFSFSNWEILDWLRKYFFSKKSLFPGVFLIFCLIVTLFVYLFVLSFLT
jgi:hypothetical protein